jgi:hypothetical protein
MNLRAVLISGRSPMKEGSFNQQLNLRGYDGSYIDRLLTVSLVLSSETCEEVTHN